MPSPTQGHVWNAAQADDLDWYPLLPDNHHGVEEIVLSVAAEGVSEANLDIAVKCETTKKDAVTNNSIHRFDANGDPIDFFTLKRGQSIPFAGSVDNKIVQVYVRGAGGAGVTTTAPPTTTTGTGSIDESPAYTATFSGSVTKA